jgi:hypothetical protein
MSGRRIIDVRGSIGEIGGRAIPIDAQIAVDEIFQNSRIEIASSQTDSQITLMGLSTATVLYIECDVDCTYTFNSSSNTELTLDADNGRRAIFLGQAITALYVTTTDAAVFKILAGGT